jgi:hypothetical protein
MKYLIPLLVFMTTTAPATFAQKPSEPSGNGDLTSQLEESLRPAIVTGVIDEDMIEAIMLAAYVASGSPIESSQETPKPGQEDRAFFGDLYEQLAEAVKTGQMTEADSEQIWEEALADVKSYYEEYDRRGEEPERSWATGSVRAGAMSFARLSIPDPGGLDTLTRPEFLKRDASSIARRLDLDELNATIVASLIEDYVDDYLARAQALREEMRIGFRAMNARETSGHIEIIENITIDRSAVRSVAESWGKGEDAVRWAEDGIDRFEEAIELVRTGLIEERRFLAENGFANGTNDAFQMIDRIKEFARYRPAARTRLLDELRTVLPESSLEEFEIMVVELLLENARQEADLGGTRIDLMQAIEETSERTPEMLAEARPAVIKENTTLIGLADQWMNARIEREISGFTLAGTMFDTGGIKKLSNGLENEDSGPEIDAFMRDVRDELESSIRFRDATLSGVETIIETLPDRPEDIGETFRRRAYLQGFSEQMRVRWCERASDCAMDGAEDDPELLESLLEIQQSIEERLPALRIRAIMDRIESEPRMARAKIRTFTDGSSEMNADARLLLKEPGFDAFDDLDDQIDTLLSGLMSEELMERCPRKPGTPLGKGRMVPGGPDSKKGKGGQGASKGKGQATGQGKGTSRGGNKK